MTEPDNERLVESVSQIRRDRWSSPLAALTVVLHAVAGLIVLAWYYMIVPRWKAELENLGVELNESAKMLIIQSDTVVNYFYLALPLVIPFLIVDFMAVRWMARRTGLLLTLFIVVCVTLLLLGNIAVGQYMLSHARDSARALMNHYGRSANPSHTSCDPAAAS